jgi:hypothetical protein
MLVSPAPSKLRVVEEVISLNPEVPLHALADGKYLAEHKVARFITRNLGTRYEKRFKRASGSRLYWLQTTEMPKRPG